MVARHIAGSEMLIAPEAGHSTYWEQPDMFNGALLGFLAKHSK
jgi:pimeloyl-ACP methyl ester carboxylesterase